MTTITISEVTRIRSHFHNISSTSNTNLGIETVKFQTRFNNLLQATSGTNALKEQTNPQLEMKKQCSISFKYSMTQLLNRQPSTIFPPITYLGSLT